MVYVFVGKYVNQIMNVTLLDMCDTSQLTYSLMIGENYNEHYLMIVTLFLLESAMISQNA